MIEISLYLSLSLADIAYLQQSSVRPRSSNLYKSSTMVGNIFFGTFEHYRAHRVIKETDGLAGKKKARHEL